MAESTSPGTSYTQIRRGPMGGDHYTKIHNGVFRDRELTGNAVKIFGWISTHDQGWSTSVAGIAQAVKIGRDATRVALSLLKRRHYLVHGRCRGEGGTLGSGWYFLTDLPAQLAEAGVVEDEVVARSVSDALSRWIQENSRSEPGWEIEYPGDSEEFSQVGTRMAKTRNLVQPTVAPRPPKKTKELQEDQGQENQGRSQHSASAAAKLERSKDEDIAYRPSLRSSEGQGNIFNDHAEDRSAAVPAGVQPPTAPSTEGLAQDAGVPVSQVSMPDDLARAESPGDTLDEQYPWTESPEEQRYERLRDLIIARIGELDPAEEHALESMVGRGEHWLKVENTILRQREWGYVRA